MFELPNQVSVPYQILNSVAHKDWKLTQGP